MNWVYQYTVKRGDTLSIIARNTGWYLRSILAVNPQITNPDMLYIGQIINIPKFEKPNYYLIKPGDTLYAVIRYFNNEYASGLPEFQITLNELLAYNPNITNPNLIYPGLYVRIPDLG